MDSIVLLGLFQRGNTALHIAAIHGKIEVVKTLIKNGATVNAKCKVMKIYTIWILIFMHGNKFRNQRS